MSIANITTNKNHAKAVSDILKYHQTQLRKNKTQIEGK
jgi:hypothetical protein